MYSDIFSFDSQYHSPELSRTKSTRASFKSLTRFQTLSRSLTTMFFSCSSSFSLSVAWRLQCPFWVMLVSKLESCALPRTNRLALANGNRSDYLLFKLNINELGKLVREFKDGPKAPLKVAFFCDKKGS